MNCHNEEGIILRPVDFRERDRILTFLTPEQGKISGIVHGARSLKSQNRAATESLVLARFEYVERRQTSMVKIEHCEALDLFPAIRKDYSRFLYASYFAELLLLTEIPSTEAPLYFNWLASILKALQNEPADLFRKAYWEWNFLCLLGVQPQLDVCLISGQPLPPDFLPSEQVFYQLDPRLGGIRSPGWAPAARSPHSPCRRNAARGQPTASEHHTLEAKGTTFDIHRDHIVRPKSAL